MFGFLHACASRSLQDELQALGRELAVGTPPREDEDQLQTDGNRCSRTLPDHGAGRRPAALPASWGRERHLGTPGAGSSWPDALLEQDRTAGSRPL